MADRVPRLKFGRCLLLTVFSSPSPEMLVSANFKLRYLMVLFNESFNRNNRIISMFQPCYATLMSFSSLLSSKDGNAKLQFASVFKAATPLSSVDD